MKSVKPGSKDVGSPFDVRINANDSEGNNALGYGEDVTIEGKGGIELSTDGGNSWSSEVTLKLNKGTGILKAKGSEVGKQAIIVSGENSSPGKLVVNMKRSKKAMNKINTPKLSHK